MTTSTLSAHILEFVEKTRQEAAVIFKAYRDTGTITAFGTVGFEERVPGEELLVSVSDPGPFNQGREITASVADFNGKSYTGGKSSGGRSRYGKLFQTFSDITTISHVHSPSLGAWAQTHRTLPIRYVPVQRYKLFRELPVYIDRRQPEVDFIIDRVREDEHISAILEANGGATVWGKKGLRDTAEFILLLEEGASIQIAAEAIGGSRNFGPGVLAQQFRMSNLTEEAKALGLLPITDL